MRNFYLKILIASFLVTTMFNSCSNSSTNEENERLKAENELLKKEQELNKDSTAESENQSSGNLEFLKSLNGKYPYEVKLLENQAFIKRLKSLLGNRFDFLKETWAVETPIEVNNNVFVASACEAHNCGSTNFIIVFDLSNNIMSVGIREEDKVKKYSETGSYPQQIIDWENGN